VCWEVRRLDSTDRAFHQAAKLLALLLGDGSAQVLNLDKTLADKNHLSHFRNSCDPGVTNQLGIERQEPLRFFRKSAGRRLPLEQAALAIECADGVDIGNEVVVAGDLPGEFDLQILLRLADLDTAVLAEPGQEHQSLPKHAIPGISVGIMQVLALVG
jgi:hypothetical protein